MEFPHLCLIALIISIGYQGYNGSYHRRIQGDMLLTREQEKAIRSKGLDRQSTPLVTPWPNGYVPYLLAPEVARHRSVIRQGLAMWEEVTCLQFAEVFNIGPVPHLEFRSLGDGDCSSFVGVTFPEGQNVSIGSGCETPQVVCHEVGHAIGLFHEQDRPDSDNFLYKHKKNLDPNFTTILDAIPNWNVYGVPYDYLSIMQYSAFAFSINERLTLVPKDHSMEEAMSNAQKPTFNDALLINRMYNCSSRCTNSGVTCQNGGYAAWVRKTQNCRCQCPSGFTGNNCQMKVAKDFCGATITSPTSILSPNYPEMVTKEVHCGWYIKAPAGKRVKVTFEDFSMLGRYDQDNICWWDVLRIRIDNLRNDDPGRKYCGTELNKQSITAFSEMGLYYQGIANGGKGFKAIVQWV